MARVQSRVGELNPMSHVTWPERKAFCGQYIVGSCFDVHSVHLCLLIGELSTFTFVYSLIKFSTFWYLLSVCLTTFWVALFLRCLVCVKSVGLLWWTCRFSSLRVLTHDSAPDRLEYMSWCMSGDPVAAGVMLTEKQGRSPLFFPLLASL